MSENAVKSTDDFYRDKGLIRHMIVISEQDRDALKKLAKDFSVKQGDVVSVLLEQMNLASIGKHFEARRVALKGETKTTKTELVKKMKDLTPEQIAAIETILAG